MILQVAKRIANIRFDYSMYSRNLFVLDFVRRFFVSCVQIFEAYAVRLAENQPQKQMQKDSESTFLYNFASIVPRSYFMVLSLNPKISKKTICRSFIIAYCLADFHSDFWCNCARLP